MDAVHGDKADRDHHLKERERKNLSPCIRMSLTNRRLTKVCLEMSFTINLV